MRGGYAISYFPMNTTSDANMKDPDAEGFNITNTANWGLPVATLNAAQFGEITGMTYAYTPRVYQFALKLTF